MTASMVFGAAKTYKFEESRHATTLARIKAAGDEQNERTQKEIARQKEISANVAQSYDAGLRSINDYYSKRLRNAVASSRKLSTTTTTTTTTNAASADTIPTERYTRLEIDCAKTTLMLVQLQTFNRQQGQSNESAKAIRKGTAQRN